MTIYYVDSSFSGGSNGSGLSAAAPLTSLEAVNKLKLQAGDTVAFKAGTTYTASAAGTGALNITASGTEKAPVTFTTYGTGPAATISNSATGYSDAINVANAKYVVIDGLAITRAGQAGINVTKSASYITIQNVEASNVGEGVMLNGTNNLVTRSYFHDLNMIKNTDNVFDDDYGAVGVMIGNSNNEVSFTKIVNARAPSYDYGYDGGGIELFGTMDNIKIHDNWVENSVGFIEAGGTKSVLTNISISNNVSLNNNGFLDLHNGGGNFASMFSNIDVSHNTIIEQNNSTKQMASVFLDAAYKTGQLSFHNNAVYLNSGDSIFKQVGDYHYGNVFYIMSSATHLYNNWSMTLNSGEKFGTLTLQNGTSIVEAVKSQSGGAGASLVSASATGLSSAQPATIVEKALIVTSPELTPASTTLAGTVTIVLNGDKITQTYDAAGALTSKVVQHADKSYDSYAYGVTGKDYASALTSYDSAGKVSRTEQYRSDGSLLTRKLYGTDTVTESYAAGGPLTNQVVQHADKSYDVYSFVTGQGSASSHTAYGADATALYTDRTLAGGSHDVTLYASNLTFKVDSGKSETVSLRGQNDHLVFDPAFANAIITGFQGGSGVGHDVIDVNVGLASDYSTVTGLMHQSGSDTLITFSPSDQILIKGVDPSGLSAANFSFHQ